MFSVETLTLRNCLEESFQIPPFRSENVVFFANLKSLFLGNEVQTGELIELVGELNSYGGRLVPIIDVLYRGGTNTLVLEQLPNDALLKYFSEQLQLSIPDLHVMQVDTFGSPTSDTIAEFQRQLKGSPAAIDGYVSDDLLGTWADMLGLKNACGVEGYRVGNNKTSLHRHLQQIGLPTPETYSAESIIEIKSALSALRRKGFKRAVIRSAIGASGIGMMKVDLSGFDGLSIPQSYFHSGACLVQGWLEKGHSGITSVMSPSVQFFIGESAIDLYEITNQILSGDSVHEGNYAPPVMFPRETLSTIIEQAGKVVRWLYEIGYKGTGSVDFILAKLGNGKWAVYVSEVNARVTGATYPSILARHFNPDGAWLMRNLRFETAVRGSMILELLEREGWLYRPGDDHGIIPINFNDRADGCVVKGQFLSLGSDYQICLSQLNTIIERMPVRISIERD